jgi:lipopolysaccharide transport system ATP-binding protein
MGDVAVRIENLSKQYRIGGPQARYKTIRETLMDMVAAPARRLHRLGRPAPPEETIWALKDVSFEIERGEVVGIIGRNGAGKTTLLKILSRITEPTTGYAEIKGRVGSLLEVGTGFHPELTGRENIYLNGAILGMRRAEIDRKFDEIVAFSEIEKFLDTPVKRYSSGMYVRLAFSVAAHLEPEILLVDEVLAVGDAAFQKKCLGKMGDVASKGRTVLFVSHNMAAISALCPRSVLLEEGRLVYDHDTHEVIEQYLNLGEALYRIPLAERQDRRGNGKITLTDVFFTDLQGTPTPTIRCGQDTRACVSYVCEDGRSLRNVEISIGFDDYLGQHLFRCPSRISGAPFDEIPPSGRMVCVIPRLPLPPGTYTFHLFCGVNNEVGDWIRHAGQVTVAGGDFFGTGRLPEASRRGLLVPYHWEIE